MNQNELNRHVASVLDRLALEYYFTGPSLRRPMPSRGVIQYLKDIHADIDRRSD